MKRTNQEELPSGKKKKQLSKRERSTLDDDTLSIVCSFLTLNSKSGAGARLVCQQWNRAMNNSPHTKPIIELLDICQQYGGGKKSKLTELFVNLKKWINGLELASEPLPMAVNEDSRINGKKSYPSISIVSLDDILGYNTRVGKAHFYIKPGVWFEFTLRFTDTGDEVMFVRTHLDGNATFDWSQFGLVDEETVVYQCVGTEQSHSEMEYYCSNKKFFKAFEEMFIRDEDEGECEEVIREFFACESNKTYEIHLDVEDAWVADAESTRVWNKLAVELFEKSSIHNIDDLRQRNCILNILENVTSNWFSHEMAKKRESHRIGLNIRNIKGKITEIPCLVHESFFSIESEFILNCKKGDLDFAIEFMRVIDYRDREYVASFDIMLECSSNKEDFTILGNIGKNEIVWKDFSSSLSLLGIEMSCEEFMKDVFTQLFENLPLYNFWSAKPLKSCDTFKNFLIGTVEQPTKVD